MSDPDLFGPCDRECPRSQSEPPPTIEESFGAFDEANPHVFRELVKMTRALLDRGHQRVGIGMLFEVLRWRRMMRTAGDEFKLNNNYRSRYARAIMQAHPELDGVFEVRELKAE